MFNPQNKGPKAPSGSTQPPSLTQQPTITRRAFVRGVAGVVGAVGVGALAASGAPWAFDGSQRVAWAASGDIETLTVVQENVFTTEDCEYIESLDGKLATTSQMSLPYGTIVWADDPNVACCLLPCETSNPLTQVGMLSLANGEVKTVLENAIGADDGFQIYDARLNSTGAIWLESDILNGKWRVYTGNLSGDAIPSPQIAAEGDADWEMPSIAVCEGYGFWQMMPVKNGAAAEEESLLMRIPLGASMEQAKAVVESKGRMACPLSATAHGIAVAPRADVKGVYYELTYVDAETGQVEDTLVLPASMKPTFVSYGETGFSFAFEDIYAYGDGISNLGTYTPATGDVDGEWLRFARTPYTVPAWCGNLIFVKSTSVVAAIDAENKTYYTIQPEHANQGYGEFLASSGSTARIVTYANIDYTPLNRARICECNVRVWNVT